jgi:tetratricopeptide (TPR) repeat protein
VLVGDPEDKKLKYGQSLPNIFIRPLGEGIVSLTLAPESEVMAAAQETMNAIAAAATAEAAATPSAAPARDAWDQALSLAGDGDYSEAVPFFEKAIEKQPEEYDRRETFAKVLYQLERFDDAQAQAQAAVAINPNAISPRMVMYSSYISQKAYDDAKRVLNEAREIAPENLNVLEQLAYVSLKQNNKKEAISSYEQIVALDAEKTDAWIQLGDLYAQTGQSDKSEQAFEKVSELAPDDAHQVFFNIGALLVNKADRTDADMKKAIDSFSKAIELKPDYGEAHKQLAFALLGTGDTAGAKAALKQYVAVAPNAPDAAQMKSLADAM